MDLLSFKEQWTQQYRYTTYPEDEIIEKYAIEYPVCIQCLIKIIALDQVKKKSTKLEKCAIAFLIKDDPDTLIDPYKHILEEFLDAYSNKDDEGYFYATTDEEVVLLESSIDIMKKDISKEHITDEEIDTVIKALKTFGL